MTCCGPSPEPGKPDKCPLQLSGQCTRAKRTWEWSSLPPAPRFSPAQGNRVDREQTNLTEEDINTQEESPASGLKVIALHRVWVRDSLGKIGLEKMRDLTGISSFRKKDEEEEGGGEEEEEKEEKEEKEEEEQEKEKKGGVGEEGGGEEQRFTE
ncbi:hypothetical protein H920_05536 [Fukomys damarensis]|uniref:Uncharacterized protein n=1 Tax=Fukomys damarensis TaxID=885580 RepID=A0A091DRL1_FUKDA|nr:hypothetical protein H920_05536 [Fukomys damarensis]